MSDGEVLETSQDGRFRVRLVQDVNPENPRKDHDQAAHALTVNDHGRYIDVDEDGGPLAEAFARCKHLDSQRCVAVFTRWAQIFHGAVVVESTPYDGVHSLWYMTGEEIAAEGITDAKGVIDGEIAEYRQWCDGEVYGYVLEQRTNWTNDANPEDTRETWEEAESCWGYYGLEYAESEARSALAMHTEPEKGK